MSKRKNLLIALAILAVPMTATAVDLPTGYDEVRTADGTMCRATTASTTYLTAEAYSSQYDQDQNSWNSTASSSDLAQDEYGLKLTLTIPLDGGIEKRVDCSRFADLELQRMEAELEQAKLELEMLKQQQSTWE